MKEVDGHIRHSGMLIKYGDQAVHDPAMTPSDLGSHWSDIQGSTEVSVKPTSRVPQYIKYEWETQTTEKSINIFTG